MCVQEKDTERERKTEGERKKESVCECVRACAKEIVRGGRDMGWLRLVGCLKIYVSLQNIGLFCRSLLQKRPISLSILLIVATPYRD